MKRSRGGGHTPAHALPPAEHPKIKAMLNRRKFNRHSPDGRAGTAEALNVRRTFTEWRQRPARVNQAPRLPEVADMLAISESVGHRSLRVARTPTFGVAVGAYLVCAWIVVGSVASPTPPDESPMAHDAAINPRAAPDAVRASTSSRPRTEELARVAPSAEQIDPQFFTGLQQVIDSFGDQVGGSPLAYSPQSVGQTTPPADPANTPLPDPLVPATPDIAPPTPTVEIPGGQAAEAPVPETTAPATPAIAPPTQIVEVPSGQAAQAPVPDPTAPATPVIAPPSQTVEITNGPTPDAISQQPSLGPPPGPAG